MHLLRSAALNWDQTANELPLEHDDGIDGVALQGRIEGILPRGRSWYPEVFIWGSEQGSDIQLSLENARVESLGIRFDLRTPDMQLFRAVFRLAEECGLVILDLARKCALPDLNGLIRAAAESDAAHFVLDPASFLAQVLTNARAT